MIDEKLLNEMDDQVQEFIQGDITAPEMAGTGDKWIAWLNNNYNYETMVLALERYNTIYKNLLLQLKEFKRYNIEPVKEFRTLLINWKAITSTLGRFIAAKIRNKYGTKNN